MFTSRAEHRLLLRIDNADLRLTAIGRAAGLVDAERWEVFQMRKARFERNLQALDRTQVRSRTGDRVPASQLLKQPEIKLSALMAQGAVSLETHEELGQFDLVSAEVSVKYAGYLLRQAREIDAAKKHQRRRIPADFSFENVPGLSKEVVQRLRQVRPDTLAHAARIPGLTPAAVAVLAVYVGRSDSSARE